MVAKPIQQWADYVHAVSTHPIVYARTLFSSPTTEFGRAVNLFTSFIKSVPSADQEEGEQCC